MFSHGGTGDGEKEKSQEDERDVWELEDVDALKSVPLPNPHRLPPEASWIALRTFVDRGLKITKLALAWWLAFNVDDAEQVKDLITIEEAIDLAVKVRSAHILTHLIEYSTPDLVEFRRTDILKWHTNNLKITHQPADKRSRLDAAILHETLSRIGWISPPPSSSILPP
jgi:hypothetical protein